MTIVVIAQSLSRCPICHDDQRVALFPIRDGMASSTPIRCPHCTNTADLHSLIGVTTSGAPE